VSVTDERDRQRAFAEESDRLTAERFAGGAVVFILVFGLAWVIEHGAHPERDRAYGVVYACEIASLLVTAAVLRLPRGRRHGRVLAAAATLGLATCIGVYHVWVHGEAEVLAIALLYLVSGVMVLFPWGWQGQLPVAAFALMTFLVVVGLGERVSVPFGISLLGLGSIAALSVGGAAFLANHRWALFRQAAELRRANAELAAANTAKNQFIASVSHELRTPLNIIVGYTDLLLEGQFGTLSVEAHDALSRVARNTRSLAYLISDLLDLSRIEAGRLNVRLSPTDLQPVFQDLLCFIAPQVEASAVRFQVHCPQPISVLADRDRLEQILVNLLSNAVKFTPRGEIHLRARPPVDAMVTIEVEDSGVGIEADELPLIFEPFRQGRIGQTMGGVGIGLSVSARLARAMGGDLSVRSEGGRGSPFVLRLPAAERPRSLPTMPRPG